MRTVEALERIDRSIHFNLTGGFIVATASLSTGKLFDKHRVSSATGSSIRSWSPDEDDAIRKYSNEPHYAEKVRLLLPHRTAYAITMRRKNLGLHRNPIGSVEPLRLKKWQAAYFAGIVDGEGTISLNKGGKKNRREQIVPSLSVFNTNEKLFKWIELVISSRVTHSRQRTRTKGHKQIYEWKTTSCLTVAQILGAILPFLVLKRRQAELVMEYCCNRIPFGSVTQRERELLKILHQLNKRGSDE